MTLFQLIRDFFVANIFGGMSSDRTIYNTFLGWGVNNGSSDTLQNHYLMFSIGNNNSISLCDWLSTTFTIITLILLVIFLYIFVKWIFKLFAGLLR